MPTLQEQLVKYLTDAHALEEGSLRQLDTHIDNSDDPDLREIFTRHKAETETHERRLRELLASHGAEPSSVKDSAWKVGAFAKAALDRAQTDDVGKNARDAYVGEHLEVASYELLERVARLAGDEQTATAAREIREEEERMIEQITSHWDQVVRQALRQEGVEVPA